MQTWILACLISVSSALHINYTNQPSWGQFCLTQKYQSPINVPLSSNLCSTVKFNITSPQTKIAINSITTQDQLFTIKYTGSTITVRKSDTSIQTVYKSHQFHFHSPSEHLLDGRSYSAQMHVVHFSSDNKIAVFGIFLEAADGDEPDLFDNWKFGTSSPSTITLPQIRTPEHVYHYQGSLTIPGCTGGVQWFLNSLPIKVKKVNLENLKKHLNNGLPNNRNIQLLNGRSIFDVGKGCVVSRLRSN